MPGRSSITNQESKVKHRYCPASRAEWRAWLATHHATEARVWLVYAKKHTGIPSLTYNDAVEEALCFGWIDSVLHPIDDCYYMQLFTPRKAKSVWSQPNKQRVDRMIAQGLMTPAGMALVERAKKTGTWDILSHVDSLTPPPALRAAIESHAKARANWETLAPGLRKQFLYYLVNAKREETRAKRIKEIVSMVARGSRPTPGLKPSAPAQSPSRARRRR